MLINKNFVQIIIVITIFFANLISNNNIKVIITSYNNAKWYKKNLDSVFEQNYSNYKIIYIDDASPDGTGNLVESYIKEQNKENQVILIKNPKNLSQMANHYYAVHMCDNNDIVVHLDGDDWLSSPNVLAMINEIYSTTDTWMTYGRALEWPQNTLWPLTETTYNDLHRRITNNIFREEEWVYGHLRTFRAWLFKEIKLQDLVYETTFEKMSPAPDVAFMYPMLEMARQHTTFLTPIMYIWNKSNPISQYRLGIEKVKKLHYNIINWKKYKPLQNTLNERLNSYKNCKADLFILPTKIQELVNLNLSDNLSNINKIKVFIPYYWQLKHEEYDIIKYDNHEKNLKNILLKEIENSTCEHLCISNDLNNLNNKIDFSLAIYYLEQTKTSFYSFGYNKSKLELKNIPYFQLYEDTLAYPQKFNIGDTFITRKSKILKKLKEITFKNFQDFCNKLSLSGNERALALCPK